MTKLLELVHRYICFEHNLLLLTVLCLVNIFSTLYAVFSIQRIYFLRLRQLSEDQDWTSLWDCKYSTIMLRLWYGFLLSFLIASDEIVSIFILTLFNFSAVVGVRSKATVEQWWTGSGCSHCWESAERPWRAGGWYLGSSRRVRISFDIVSPSEFLIRNFSANLILPTLSTFLPKIRPLSHRMLKIVFAGLQF